MVLSLQIEIILRYAGDNVGTSQTQNNLGCRTLHSPKEIQGVWERNQLFFNGDGGRGQSGYCGRGEVLTYILVRDVGYKLKIMFSHCAGEVMEGNLWKKSAMLSYYLGKLDVPTKTVPAEISELVRIGVFGVFMFPFEKNWGVGEIRKSF